MECFSTKGLIPLLANRKQVLRGSLAKSSHFSSKNHHYLEFATWRTIPSSLLLLICQVICEACLGVLYILFNLGIIGKCLKTFCGTSDFPTSLYWATLHYGQFWSFSYCPWNNMCPFGQAWITLYASWSFFKVFDASYSLEGKVLGWGKMPIFNRCNISLINVLLIPWVQQQLRISNVVANPDSVAPSYNGTYDASLNMEWFGPNCGSLDALVLLKHTPIIQSNPKGLHPKIADTIFRSQAWGKFWSCN